MSTATSPARGAENRLSKFASFFKGYMGVMPLVTAAFAPVLTLSKAIPVFDSEKGSLATFAGLFGFLLVAATFSCRSELVPALLYQRGTPLQFLNGPA